MAGSWNTGADIIISNIEESIFQKQTDNTCIKLLNITKMRILKCDELVLHFARHVRNSYVNVWNFIYWKVCD